METFATDGYGCKDVIDIINSARTLKKYGDVKLAYGDLISHYEDSNPDRINWDMVKKGVERICKGDMKTLNEVSRRILGVNFIKSDDREKLLEFIKSEVEEAETKRTEKQLQAQDDEAQILIRNDNLERAKQIKKEYAIEQLEDVAERIATERTDYFRAIKIIKAKIRNL